MNKENIILQAINLEKLYINGGQELRVLKEINLAVEKGEFLSIIGPSGVGKSTLLHLLGGLDKPTKGEVFLRNLNIYEFNDSKLAALRNKRIGFIFQFHYLLPEFTALENVMMPRLIRGENSCRQKAEEILIELGLKERISHKPQELSGGERQRVAVARALINEPEIILADEPTGNLDKENGESVFRLLEKLNETKGQTFIMVTHNEQLAQRSKRMIQMVDGEIKRNI